jgi:ABC-type Mn2+/Zn2+ transport system permease subunit
VLDAFDVPYMQRALAVGLLLAVPLGLLGVWVVLRGLAFFAHAVGVATLPGVVVGLTVPALGPFAGALLAAGLFTGAGAWIETDERLRGGAVSGLLLAGALAIGAVLLATVAKTSAPVESTLFGTLLGLSSGDIAVSAVAAAVTVAAAVVALPRLAATTLDPAWADSAGGRSRLTTVALHALVALVVIAALPAVGSLLVSGLLVVPAATARLLTDRLEPMIAASVALCAATVVAGLLVARELDAPPGAVMAMLAGAGFAAALVGRGVVARRAGARLAGAT